MADKDSSGAFLSMSSADVEDICEEHVFGTLWVSMEILMLLLGLATNLPLAWLFIKERKDLSPAQVLGVNLLVMQLLHIVMAPAGIAIRIVYEGWENHTRVNANATAAAGATAGLWRVLDEGAYALVMTGCPLLLACMCLERYGAAARPLLYLRTRKWGYKIAVSATVWTVTLLVVVTTFLERLEDVTTPMSALVCLLFLVMLACLVGLAWSLGRRGPAHSGGARTRKRRALGNVLRVIVPAVFAYLPVFLLAPVLHFGRGDALWCNAREGVLFCPYLGVCIGPMFYWPKFRRLLWGGVGGGGGRGGGGGGGGAG